MADKSSNKWNAEANEKILLIIIKNSDGKLPYDEIAKALNVTTTAVKSHIARLKTKAKTATTDVDPSSDAGLTDDGSTKTTKRKRGAGTATVKGRSTTTKGRASKKVKSEETVTEEDEEATVDEEGNEEEE